MSSVLLSRSILAGLFVLLCGASSAFAETAPAPTPAAPTRDLSKLVSGEYALDKSHANVIFKINHIGFSNYIGRFNNFDGKLNFDAKAPEKSSVEVTIDVTSIDTNHKKLETDLQGEKFFNTTKFPSATFKSNKITYSGEKGLVVGDLTMMGVTKPVTLNVLFHGGGMGPFSKSETLGFNATTTLKRSEWGLAALVPMVSDDVQLEIEVEFNNKAPAAPAAASAVPAHDDVKKK